MRYMESFERMITRALLFMMAGVVLLATVELGWVLDKDVLSPPLFLLGTDEMLEVFGQFLLVLIGIELLHSMRVYTEHREVHMEAVLVVAEIAVARKIIVLDPKDLSPGTLLGVAAVMLGLTAGLYLAGRRRVGNRESDPETRP